MELSTSTLALFFLTGIVLIFFIVIITILCIKSHRRRPEIADEFVLGAKGKALTDVSKESGQVFVKGTIWEAKTKGETIKKDEKINVVNIDGLELIVEIKFE